MTVWFGLNMSESSKCILPLALKSEIKWIKIVFFKLVARFHFPAHLFSFRQGLVKHWLYATLKSRCTHYCTSSKYPRTHTVHSSYTFKKAIRRKRRGKDNIQKMIFVWFFFIYFFYLKYKYAKYNATRLFLSALIHRLLVIRLKLTKKGLAFVWCSHLKRVCRLLFKSINLMYKHIYKLYVNPDVVWHLDLCVCAWIYAVQYIRSLDLACTDADRILANYVATGFTE